MSGNNLSNFHICLGDDGLERVNYLRRLGYMRSPNNRPYLPSSTLIWDEPKRIFEKHYPDPISEIRESLRVMDRQFLRSCPYVFQIHDSWIASYPVSDWRGLSHRIAIFHDWGDAMKFANEVAARD